jgi:hypothetical protein
MFFSSFPWAAFHHTHLASVDEKLWGIFFVNSFGAEYKDFGGNRQKSSDSSLFQARTTEKHCRMKMWDIWIFHF